MDFYHDYQELFAGAAAYYDGSYSGTTLYNVLNPSQNATMGANANVIADRNGFIKAMKTNPSSTSDSTAKITCYPKSGSLYGMCGWCFVNTWNSLDWGGTIQLNSSKNMISFGDYTGSYNPYISTVDIINTRNTYSTASISTGWNHIIVLWDGSKYTFYVNGALQPQSYYSGRS